MTMPRPSAGVLTLTHSDWATGLFPGDPRTFWLVADPQGRRVKGAVILNRRRALAAAAVRLLSARPGESGRHVLLTGVVADWRLRFRIFSFSPPLDKGAARTELNAGREDRLSLHPGARDCRVRWCQWEIKMTVLYRDRCRQAPCPTRGIIDIAAVRNRCRRRPAAQRSTTARYWPLVNTMRSTGRKRHQREYTDYEASAH